MTACLYFGDSTECQFCGGYVFAEGDGPNNVEGPHGIRFCSHECLSGYEDWLADPPSAPFFCESCGTDDDSEHWEPCHD